MSAVRWNLAVSADTDQSVRMYLAARGGGRKGDLSKFIEAAVRDYLFERTVEDIKQANADLSEDEMNDLIDEAVAWARKNKD
ncbi:MAG: ribbon-helix-helix domain-containing protein [Pseudoxanthomonas sp.]